MQVILADHAGFCFGVKRAVDIVEEALKSHNKVSLLGPIIHNPQEVSRLEKLGAESIESADSCDHDSKIVISTHGVAPAIITSLQEKGFAIIDTTCPIVKKAQSAAKDLEEEGYTVLVVGKSSHPEVLGIMGHLKHSGYIIQHTEEIKTLSFTKKDRIGIIAQTTMSEEIFRDVVYSLVLEVSEIKVINTICAATRLRQDAAVHLAQKVEGMIILGGYNSANTCRLFELCKKVLKDTYHVEASEDIRPEWFHDKNTVGVTAGASTPDWVIEKTVERLQEIKSLDPNPGQETT